MLTQEKIDAMKRIKEEFRDLNNNPISNIGVTVGLPNEDNIFEWQCSLMGPRDTSYSGGIFILSVKFPDNYPKKRPEVVFRTPIYHLNINPVKLNYEGAEPLGYVSISTLYWWKEDTRMKKVLIDIFALFYMPNPYSPYEVDRADEFRNNRATYEEKIKYFTKKYANPLSSGNKIDRDHDWNFNYP